MSYIVLARKWRPQIFDDLKGQDTIVNTLKNALSAGRIVHAYLFSGPRGVGKTSTARILAKALNCEEGPTSRPCCRCQQCTAITEGTSVDVIEIDGASNTQVEAIRELRESVKYAPSSGRYKIYIIDEVHMLSPSAFNALLKTLEEPPSHVIFIFATTEPKKIPSTIHSRCQHHAFRKIPKGTIKARLKEIITKENINIRDTSLEMIARAADGSIRDALTLLDQVSSFSDEITEEEIRTILGLPETEVIRNLSQSIIEGNISSTISIIKELADRGYDIRFLTKELIEHFRNLTMVKVVDDVSGILDLTNDEVDSLKSQVSALTVEQLTLLMTELMKLESEVRTAMNPRYTLELGLLRMSFIKGMVSIGEILKLISNPNSTVGHKVSVSQVPEKKTEQKESDRDRSLPPPDKKDIWQRLIKEIDSEDHRLAGKLIQANLIEMSEKDITIGFNGGMSVLAGLIKDKTEMIEERLYRLTGRKLRLKIVNLPEKKIREDNRDVKERIVSEPLVQGVIRLFNGSIVEIKQIKNQIT